ncbi:MAG: magnesium transporter [Halodesulfurarchaeum sp.]
MTGAPGALGSWQYRRIVRTMFPLLVVLSVIVLLAGITLQDAEELLAEYGLLAIMVPTMIGTGGNLGAILSSRLTTRFHLGVVTFDITDRTVLANVAAVFALGVTIFTALALGAYLIGLLTGIGELQLDTLLVISLVSGLSVVVIAVVLSFLATWVSYRLGIDPDDTTIPIVTNVVDVFGMVVFLGVSAIVVGL